MYGITLLVLQVTGLAVSVWFLATHRPRKWRRLQALDAMGFPVIVAIVFARSLVLTALAWPLAARGLGNMIFSVLTLGLVDTWMIIKLINFRRYARDVSE